MYTAAKPLTVCGYVCVRVQVVEQLERRRKIPALKENKLLAIVNRKLNFSSQPIIHIYTHNLTHSETVRNDRSKILVARLSSYVYYHCWSVWSSIRVSIWIRCEVYQFDFNALIWGEQTEWAIRTFLLCVRRNVLSYSALKNDRANYSAIYFWDFNTEIWSIKARVFHIYIQYLFIQRPKHITLSETIYFSVCVWRGDFSYRDTKRPIPINLIEIFSRYHCSVYCFIYTFRSS